MADQDNKETAPPPGFTPDPAPAGFTEDTPAAPAGFTADDTKQTKPDAAAAPATTPTPGAKTDEQIREEEDKKVAGGMSPMGEMGSQRPNVQLGVPDRDRMISFGYNPDMIQKSGLYQFSKNHMGSGFDWMLSPKSANDPASSFFERGPVGGFVQGLSNLVMGGAQDIAHLLPNMSKEDAAYVDMLVKMNEENYRQNSLGGQQPGFWTQRATEAAPIMALPLPKAGPKAGILTRGAEGAGVGTIFSGLQPVTNVDPNDPSTFKNQKLQQMGLGAGVGAAANAILPPTVQGLVGLGWRGLNTVFGKTQLPEDMARDFQQMLESRASGNGWGPNLAKVQAAANSGDKRVASIARNVLDQLHSADASGRPGDITQAAISMQDLLTRIESNQRWDNVTQIGQKYGTAPALNTMKTMRGLINDLTKRNLKPDPQLANLIESYRQNFITDTQQGKVPRQVDFDQMRQFLSEIQGDIDAAHSKTGQTFITNTQTPYLAKIRDAMRDDIEDFLGSKNANDLRQAWEDAKDYYASYRVPFADKLISKAGATPEADSIIDMFTKPGGADRAHALFQSLDPRGQDTVKAQMIEKLIRAGTGAEEEQITPQSAAVKNGFVDPKKMLTALQKYKEPFNAFFTGGDQQALGGLENMMRQAALAEKNQIIPVGIGAGVTGMAAHAAGIPWGADIAGFGIGAAAVKAGLGTREGRRILYAAMAEKPGTPAMAALVKQLNNLGNLVRRAGPRFVPSFATQPQSPVSVKPWDPNWQPPQSPQFRSGGLARLRRNTLASLRSGSN